MTTSYLGNMGLGQEAAFGEEAAATVFEGILDESMAMESEQIRLATTNGMRVASHTMPGRVSAGGDVTTLLAPEGATPWMLKGVLGKVVSTETAEPGVFSHVFTPLHSTALPSFTLRTSIAEMSEAWLGCTFSDMSISVTRGEPVEIVMGALAQRPAESAPPVGPSFSTVAPFVAGMFAFTMNGAENFRIENFTLNFENDIEVSRALNKNRYCSKHYVGGLSVSGSVTLEFDSEIERRRLWGSLNARTPENIILPGSLTAVATHTAEAAEGVPFSLAINIPELYYKSAPANISRDKGRALQRIFFTPSWNRAAGEIISITLLNTAPGYPDAIQED